MSCAVIVKSTTARAPSARSASATCFGRVPGGSILKLLQQTLSVAGPDSEISPGLKTHLDQLLRDGRPVSVWHQDHILKPVTKRLRASHRHSLENAAVF